MGSFLQIIHSVNICLNLFWRKVGEKFALRVLKAINRRDGARNGAHPSVCYVCDYSRPLPAHCKQLNRAIRAGLKYTDAELFFSS